MHSPILRHLESLGFLTSVHRMGDYGELHAVKLPDEEIVHIALADGDNDEDVYLRGVRAGADVRGRAGGLNTRWRI